MKLSRCLCAFSFLFSISSMQVHATGVSVEQLLDVLPELADLKPSPVVRPGIVGKIITIDGKTYNVRYCYYESADPQFNDPFKVFARNKKYLNNVLKSYSPAELPIGPVMTFGSNEEDKKNKIFYMISILYDQHKRYYRNRSIKIIEPGKLL